MSLLILTCFLTKYVVPKNPEQDIHPLSRVIHSRTTYMTKYVRIIAINSQLTTQNTRDTTQPTNNTEHTWRTQTTRSRQGTESSNGRWEACSLVAGRPRCHAAAAFACCFYCCWTCLLLLRILVVLLFLLLLCAECWYFRLLCVCTLHASCDHVRQRAATKSRSHQTDDRRLARS